MEKRGGGKVKTMFTYNLRNYIKYIFIIKLFSIIMQREAFTLKS